MICYKDTTFCSSKVKKHTCEREITKEELEHAEKIGLPIAYGEFCKDDYLINVYERINEWQEKYNVEVSDDALGELIELFY